MLRRTNNSLQTEVNQALGARRCKSRDLARNDVMREFALEPRNAALSLSEGRFTHVDR